MNTFNVTQDHWVLMEKYNSSGFDAGGYNDNVIKTANALYPYDPEGREAYINANLLDDSFSWDWGNRANRTQYQVMRKNSLENEDYALVASGIIVLNHVISAINAVRATGKHNKQNVQVYSSLDSELTPFINLSVKF
jgi:hypothetical protein